MRQVDSPLPNLGQSRGPYRGMGSKGWVPRNTVARVGALFFGSFFGASGLTVFASTFLLKVESQRLISSPLIAYLVSLVAVMMSLAVASFLIWYGVRLVVGSFRRSSNEAAKPDPL